MRGRDRTFGLVGASVVAWGTAMAACGSSAPSAPPADGGGEGFPAGEAGGPDGIAGGGDRGDGAARVVSGYLGPNLEILPGLRGGFVGVVVTDGVAGDGGPSVSTTEEATFFDVTTPQTCFDRAFGLCVESRCPNLATKVGSQGGGVVTLTSDAAAAPITVEPPTMPGYRYANANQDGATFPGGSLVTVTGAGSADVPAFTASIAAAAPIFVPSPAAGTQLTVSRAAPFAVRWTGGSGATVELLFAQRDSYGYSQMRCSFPGDPGVATIDAGTFSPNWSGGGLVMVFSVVRGAAMAGTLPILLATSTVGFQGTAFLTP